MDVRGGPPSGPIRSPGGLRRQLRHPRGAKLKAHRLALLGVLLLGLVPTALAAQGIALSRLDDGPIQLQAPGTEGYAEGIHLRIDLAQATAVQLVSSLVDAGGAPVNHTMLWAKGDQVYRTNRTAIAATQAMAAGSNDLVGTLSVPHVLQGAYTLRLFAWVADSASGTGGSTTSAAISVPVRADQVDGQAPDRVLDVSVAIADGSPQVSWGSVTDPQGDAVSYEVLRSAEAGFAADAGNLVGQTSLTHLRDPSVQEQATYHYRVRAIDASGHRGLASPEVSASTPKGPDTTPPGPVGNLTSGNPTDRSISLDWLPAQDDRPSLIHYRVGRDGAALGNTTFTYFTDDGLSPGSSFHYTVTPVDGDGNVGPASEVVASTLGSSASPSPAGSPPSTGGSANASSDSSGAAGATQDGAGSPANGTSQEAQDLPAASTHQPPAIRGVTITQGDSGTVVAWQTDEETNSTLALDAPQGAQAFPAGHGVRFQANVGSLEAGLHRFHIEATDQDGARARLDSAFLVQDGSGAAMLRKVDAGFAKAIAQDAGGSPPAALYIVEDASTGAVQGVQDALGFLSVARAIPQDGRFLLVSGTGRLVLLQPYNQQVLAVDSPRASIQSQTIVNGSLAVELSLEQKSGWVRVSIDDPFPGHGLLGVRRSDGTALDLNYTWREAGKLSFLDDPAQTYQLLFEGSPETPRDAGHQSAHAGLSGLPVFAALAVAALVGRRARRAR